MDLAPAARRRAETIDERQNAASLARNLSRFSRIHQWHSCPHTGRRLTAKEPEDPRAELSPNGQMRVMALGHGVAHATPATLRTSTVRYGVVVQPRDAFNELPITEVPSMKL